MGQGRQELYVRRPGREEDAGRTVRRPQPAHRLSLHARTGLEEGCPSCSFLSDHFDGATVHLAHRDVTLCVSRAPLAQIAAFKARMGWRFPWVSSFGNDFNRDFHVSFTKDELDKTAYYNYDSRRSRRGSARRQRVLQERERRRVPHLFDLWARPRHPGRHLQPARPVPKGRDEDDLAFTMAWVRHHDEYEDKPKGGSCCGS